MKAHIYAGALLAILATPALASGPQAERTQEQSQAAFGGSGGSVKNNSPSSARAASSSRAQNTTKSLNKQSLANSTSANNAQANQMSTSDESKTEVYAVSYTDAAPPTVAASIGDGVAVTTWGVKVLGPVFGMTDQHVHYLPKAIEAAAQLSYLATTNDGTYEGEQVQFAHIAAVCAHDAELAKQLNLGCR